MSQAIAEFCFDVAEVLMSISGYTLLFLLAVVVPLALARKTRGIAGIILAICAWVFFAVGWFYSAALTLAIWGWLGLVIGIFFVGVGVVPIAILAAILEERGSDALTVVLFVGGAYVLNLIGSVLSQRRRS